MAEEMFVSDSGAGGTSWGTLYVSSKGNIPHHINQVSRDESTLQVVMRPIATPQSQVRIAEHQSRSADRVSNVDPMPPVAEGMVGLHGGIARVTQIQSAVAVR